jgi:hypothetical protein
MYSLRNKHVALVKFYFVCRKTYIEQSFEHVVRVSFFFADK